MSLSPPPAGTPHSRPPGRCPRRLGDLGATRVASDGGRVLIQPGTARRGRGLLGSWQACKGKARPSNCPRRGADGSSGDGARQRSQREPREFWTAATAGAAGGGGGGGRAAMCFVLQAGNSRHRALPAGRPELAPSVGLAAGGPGAAGAAAALSLPAGLPRPFPSGGAGAPVPVPACRLQETTGNPAKVAAEEVQGG